MSQRKLAIDGCGPFGEVWHRPRVLHSTNKYTKFVSKLRKEEDMMSSSISATAKHNAHLAKSECLHRAEKKGKMQYMQRKADNLMKSYNESQDIKRGKLREVLQREEHRDIQLMVKYAQDGQNMHIEQKRERLKYLKSKRQKEFEESHREPQITNCNDIEKKIHDLHLRDSKLAQQYQILEKKMMKDQEKIWEDKWREEIIRVEDQRGALKDREALERLERTKDCAYFNYNLNESKTKDKKAELLLAKEQAKQQQKDYEAMIRKESEDRENYNKQKLSKSMESLQDTQECKIQLKQEEEDVKNIYLHFMEAQFDQDKFDAEHIKRKALDLKDANNKLSYLKEQYELMKKVEEKNKELAKIPPTEADKFRCNYKNWQECVHKKALEGVKTQLEINRIKADDKQKLKEIEKSDILICIEKAKDEQQSFKEAERIKKQRYRCEIMEQIEQNKQRKEKEKEDNANYIKSLYKSDLENEELTKKILQKPFHSRDIHHFTKTLYYEMTKKCTCEK